MTIQISELVASAAELHRLVDKLTARYGPTAPQVEAVRKLLERLSVDPRDTR